MTERCVVLDTETTGISHEQGHRIIEIGCVLLENRRLTTEKFHVYLNPHRAIDPGAQRVHGITNGFLKDKPRFEAVIDDFLAFIDGATLVIHNAPFDIGHLNAELKRMNHAIQDLTQQCEIIDTLAMARKKYSGQKNNLDALCKRLGVKNTHRVLHGALLDAEILADVYLAMTGGQRKLALKTAGEQQQRAGDVIPKLTDPAVVIAANASELKTHDQLLSTIQKKSGQLIWE